MKEKRRIQGILGCRSSKISNVAEHQGLEHYDPITNKMLTTLLEPTEGKIMINGPGPAYSG